MTETTKSKAEQDHAKAIKLCNIAASQLGWKANDQWEGEHGIKKRFGGELSLKDMKLYQLNAVLAHARACGFKITHKTPRGRSRALQINPECSMIRGLWLELFNLQAVRDPSEKALAAWVKRQTRKDALQFCSAKEIEKLIEALKVWRVRTLAHGWFDCGNCGTATVLTEADYRTILQKAKTIADVEFNCQQCQKPLAWKPNKEAA